MVQGTWSLQERLCHQPHTTEDDSLCLGAKSMQLKGLLVRVRSDMEAPEVMLCRSKWISSFLSWNFMFSHCPPAIPGMGNRLIFSAVNNCPWGGVGTQKSSKNFAISGEPQMWIIQHPGSMQRLDRLVFRTRGTLEFVVDALVTPW